MRYSGWAHQLRAVLASGALRRGDPLHITACFRHEHQNNWERAAAKLPESGDNWQHERCMVYASDLLAFVRNESGFDATLHVCEQSMAHDFVQMALAPVLLSSSSSMSFVAGFFGVSGARGSFQAAARLLEPRSGCAHMPRCPRAQQSTSAARQPLQFTAEDNRCAGCEAAARQWMTPSEHVLRHAEVVDYLDTTEVIRLLRAPAPS